MFTIIKKTIKDKYKSFLIYSVANILMILLYVSMFPLISQQMDSMMALLNSMPQELLKAFNSDAASMTTFEGILSGKQFSMLWPFITVAFTTNFAAYAISQEIDKKTFSILLSQPISRARIYWGKYLTGLVFTILYVVLSVTITIPLVNAFDVSVNEINILKFSLEAMLFSFCFFSLAFMVSAIAKESAPVYFIVIGLVVGMYFLQVMSIFAKELESLKYFSTFYYFDSGRSLVKGDLMPEALFLFGLVGSVSAIIGSAVFKKRDIAV
jgi:ABC-2 type transport system permease protein